MRSVAAPAVVRLRQRGERAVENEARAVTIRLRPEAIIFPGEARQNWPVGEGGRPSPLSGPSSLVPTGADALPRSRTEYAAPRTAASLSN